MYNPDKYKSTRLSPLQSRGKERVRTILAASLRLFEERGIEEVTTNEIALQAKIPIGSLYRYFPNKDAIIKVLTDLYVEDLSGLFADIASHPLFPLFSWDELLSIMVDSWVQYSRVNGSCIFLYSERSNLRIRSLTHDASVLFGHNFTGVLSKHCNKLTTRQLTIVLQFSITASEIGINNVHVKNAEPNLHHEAIGAIATYLDGICHDHHHLDHDPNSSL